MNLCLIYNAAKIQNQNNTAQTAPHRQLTDTNMSDMLSINIMHSSTDLRQGNISTFTRRETSCAGTTEETPDDTTTERRGYKPNT